MTIHGTSLRMWRLDAQGQPTGTQSVDLPGFVDVEIGDEFEDDDITPITTSDLQYLTLDVTLFDVNPVALYLITGSRRFLGYPRPLKIDGREYRRRRRSR